MSDTGNIAISNDQYRGCGGGKKPVSFWDCFVVDWFNWVCGGSMGVGGRDLWEVGWCGAYVGRSGGGR